MLQARVSGEMVSVAITVTVMFQIQQVRVPEEFRRDATLLMKFLEDQSVKSGDTTCQTNFPSDQPLLQHCQEGGGGQGTSLVGLTLSCIRHRFFSINFTVCLVTEDNFI